MWANVIMTTLRLFLMILFFYYYLYFSYPLHSFFWIRNYLIKILFLVVLLIIFILAFLAQNFWTLELLYHINFWNIEKKMLNYANPQTSPTAEMMYWLSMYYNQGLKLILFFKSIASITFEKISDVVGYFIRLHKISKFPSVFTKRPWKISWNMFSGTLKFMAVYWEKNVCIECATW